MFNGTSITLSLAWDSMYKKNHKIQVDTSLIENIKQIIINSRATIVRKVNHALIATLNHALIATYWQIGSEIVANVPNFFDEFKKPFLDYLITNKNDLEFIFTTKSNIQQVLENFNIPEIPSGFAKEIRYLREERLRKLNLKMEL